MMLHSIHTSGAWAAGVMSQGVVAQLGSPAVDLDLRRGESVNGSGWGICLTGLVV